VWFCAGSMLAKEFRAKLATLTKRGDRCKSSGVVGEHSVSVTARTKCRGYHPVPPLLLVFCRQIDARL